MTDVAVPEIVERAEALAQRVGFPLTRQADGPSCSLPEVGPLLAMLAAGCVGGRIGEVGTGVGYGTAWMLSALPIDASIITVELDPERAAAAAELFAHAPRVTVVCGDWRDAIPQHGPYDLLFADGGGLSQLLEQCIDLLKIGGRLLVDDVTPRKALPPDSIFRDTDAKREALFGNPRLASV